MRGPLTGSHRTRSSFIINKLLLIIQAPLHTMHVLYMKGGREKRKRRRLAGSEREKKETVRREKWLEWEAVGMWDLQKRATTKKETPETYCTKGGGGGGEDEAVTCGSHPHPIYLHFIISLISITSHTSSPPFSSSYWSAPTFMGSGKTDSEREQVAAKTGQ